VTQGQPHELDILPEVYELRPWYHDFARLGLKTDFSDLPPGAGQRIRDLLSYVKLWLASRNRVERRGNFSLRDALSARPSSHRINQRHKEECLIPFLARCLDDLGERPACLELFCADGYYSCIMNSLKPEAIVTGVDLNTTEIKRARAAARLLGFQGANFVVDDVWAFIQAADAPYELILCAGGLYHLTEPRRLLELLRKIAARFLVVQSVVTLEVEDADYFVAPAPGWKHGSRFTHAGLARWLADLGWQILAEARNELTGNPRLCDRGSSYFLCLAPGAQR
jgi:hypothetical protein